MKSAAPIWVLIFLLIAGCGGGGSGNGSGSSGTSSDGGSASTGAVPAAPTGLAAVPGNAQASLSWTTSATAVTYNVYTGTSSGGESSTPTATGITGLAYVASNLTNGNAYYFKVAAVNANGTSALSAEATTTPATIPAAPSNVTATANSGQLVLNWTPSSGATSYNVYEGTSSGGEVSTPIAAGVTSPTATISGLTNGSIYFFTIAAINVDVTGPASAEISGVPVAPSVANGQLTTGVLVLTAAQENQIVSEAPSLVTFSGAISIQPGTVFLTNDNAYIAVSSITASGQTLISVRSPQVNDVFSNLQISGTFPLTSDTIVQSSSQASNRSTSSKRKLIKSSPAVTGTLSQTYPINESIGGFSASGNVTATLTVNISFNYSNGAVQAASVTVNQTNQTSITAALTSGAGGSSDFPITTFNIPIPVSVVDALLNAVGVRVASINVPVSVVLSGNVQFNETATLTASSQATATATYVSGSTPTVTGSISGATNLSVDPNSVSSTGDDVVATLQANAGLYLHLKPALAFLNTVALLGADVQAGPTAHFNAQIVAETPPFCVAITKSLDGELSGFFKTVGVNVTTSSLNVTENLPPAIYVGSCSIPTNVTAIVDASSLPATYYSQIQVDVTVTPQSSTHAQGQTPSGTVTVTMNGNICQAMLDSGGTGSCTLPASPAGAAVPYQLSYGGDSNFSPATNTASVSVGQASTTTGLTIPAMNTTRSQVVFSASIAADPAINASGALDPSGTVEIDDPSNNTLCVITLNGSGTGTCAATFQSAVSESVTAQYSGDTNYLPSSNTGALVVTDSPVTVTLIASSSSISFGTPVTLTWMSSGATSCTQSGGAAGDLWGGATVLLSGQQSASESAAGTYTYVITCASPDGTIQKQASATVGVQPTLTLSANKSSASTGTPFGITWASAGASSCTESGGSSGDGWTGTTSSPSGTQMVTESAAGTFTYTMACVSQDGTVQASESTVVSVTSNNGWVGTWSGTVTSSCGSYSGPATVMATIVGPNLLSWDADTNIGEFDWTMTISGNTATGTLDGQTATLTLSGNTITANQPASCQTATLTRQ
jgi:fibronectin type 3 domain-containing protein